MKTMKTGGYTVKFVSYSGVSVTYGEGLSREEAENFIRRRLRLARYLGNPISKTGRGSWEIETPEDSAGISDNQGFLTVFATTKVYRNVFGRRVVV